MSELHFTMTAPPLFLFSLTKQTTGLKEDATTQF